jgi:hypothetical protein
MIFPATNSVKKRELVEFNKEVELVYVAVLGLGKVRLIRALYGLTTNTLEDPEGMQ